MFNSSVYLSIPAVKTGKEIVNNDQIIEKVYNNFRGKIDEWRKIETGITFVFRYCNTQVRYLGLEEGKTPLDYAIDASHELIKNTGIDSQSIDLLIYGGIYREYFEPATAMEIAAKLGIKKISAFDVTNACAGMLQAVHVAASLMQTNPKINIALCCSADIPDDAINYDIQTFDELNEKSAGLTLGGGASAWFVTREALRSGGARLIEFQNTSIPASFEACKVPLKLLKFQSVSKIIFDLGLENVPGEINSIIKNVGWKIHDIDYFIAHQPSRKIIHDICNIVGVPVEKAPIIHHLYGNTINSSIPMTMDYILRTKGLKKGDKLVFNAAAAGFSMVTGAAVWE